MKTGILLLVAAIVVGIAAVMLAGCSGPIDQPIANPRLFDVRRDLQL